MKEEIDATIAELGTDRMKADIEQEIRARGFGGGPRQGGSGMRTMPKSEAKPEAPQATQSRKNNGWLSFNEDGSYSYDLDKHLYYLARYSPLKVAPSFSNAGLYANNMNEDNLFGTRDQEYAPFNAWSWNHDSRKNSVGLDDTGLTWEEYLKMPEGQELVKQIKMTSAMDYLLENKADVPPPTGMSATAWTTAITPSPWKPPSFSPSVPAWLSRPTTWVLPGSRRCWPISNPGLPTGRML